MSNEEAISRLPRHFVPRNDLFLLLIFNNSYNSINSAAILYANFSRELRY